MDGSSQFRIEIPGGDELELSLELSGGIVNGARLRGVGGPEMLTLLEQWRPKLKGALKELPLPEETSGPAMMLRELLLKARGEWAYPYAEDEVCHCRAVPRVQVDAAIFYGAHTPEVVSRWTSASTQCGNCRKDVQAILRYRLAKSG